MAVYDIRDYGAEPNSGKVCTQAIQRAMGTPVVEDIYFKDISLRTIAGNAVYLCGLPEAHFKNICLENVKAHGKYGMRSKNIDGLRLINTDISGECED